MSRLENSEFQGLVDELAMLVIYALIEHKAYTFEELNEEDKAENTLYFSPLGKGIFHKAVNEIETLLYCAGIRREVE